MDSLMSVEVKQNLEMVTGKNFENSEVLALTFAKLNELNPSANAKSAEEPALPKRELEKGNVKLPGFRIPEVCVKHIGGSAETSQSLYIVHPIEGNTDKLELMASKLKCKVYGIQCVTSAPLTTVEELASYYIKVGVEKSTIPF